MVIYGINGTACKSGSPNCQSICRGIGLAAKGTDHLDNRFDTIGFLQAQTLDICKYSAVFCTGHNGKNRYQIRDICGTDSDLVIQPRENVFASFISLSGGRIKFVNCNQVTDLSPLADCVSLRGVNMSFLFGADDLSPLYGLENLERLFMGRNDLPQETIDEARAALPNCWVTDKSESVQWISFNYSIGWRLDDEHTLADWYLEICPIFGYTRKIY